MDDSAQGTGPGAQRNEDETWQWTKWECRKNAHTHTVTLRCLYKFLWAFGIICQLVRSICVCACVSERPCPDMSSVWTNEDQIGVSFEAIVLNACWNIFFIYSPFSYMNNALIIIMFGELIWLNLKTIW